MIVRLLQPHSTPQLRSEALSLSQSRSNQTVLKREDGGQASDHRDSSLEASLHKLNRFIKIFSDRFDIPPSLH
jgi:hypothetical protein